MVLKNEYFKNKVLNYEFRVIS